MERSRGINYEVGMKFHPEHQVDYEAINQNIEKDLEDIKEMGCDSVRIYGDNPENLIVAAKTALEKGLKVWLSPRLINGEETETLDLLLKIAGQAEQLRLEHGDNITLVIGNELMIDSRVVFEEENYADRIAQFKKFKALEMAKKYGKLIGLHKVLPDTEQFKQRVQELTKKLALQTREHFKGKITYASLPDEDIDWEHFDIVGVNLYKDALNSGKYAKELERYKSHGKPVAITEFGTAPFKGAKHLGGYAHSVIDWQRGKLKRGMGFLPVLRDEKAQADYLETMIKMYEKHEIDAHFIFEYINLNTLARPEDPKRDLSTGSFALTHNTPAGERIQTQAYHRVKSLYKGENEDVEN
ncbi:MAG: hypothetical protein A2821_04745 [Candidatus Magasanikbacteria bacterium RIFCSPHIGHO2_01_FULL_41_23]|uniref:Abortive infection protein n=1 Tax=Candidatus Magasanikbacteria bacterium RIFCSPLOWO2_01_FULL_40_15 TaxID=1798686 RepID=A0A1F6N414_9BACT|nr:MAG: hypothetical protein A2821_04745 [Candidatus Magasanikbacteria bacterium RIFCSPHIGHO2_01_FULL_41_23]OGH74600.1 MAG: hypothetical protein A3F22_03540 [Candidatus Magasanikbacteria bacterium RIFCSPHIGHO2_12_FULL_41_16]OGH78440.1 MAG: hypothetical protein A2983_04700 [Candidatus Magasanikbacteria bacterium RIFCSPLOWO2_01_FULL_40_15]